MFSAIYSATLSIIALTANNRLPEKPVMQFMAITYEDLTYKRLLDTTTVSVYSNYVVVNRAKKRFNDTIFVQNKEIIVRKYNSFKTEKEKFISSEEVRDFDLNMKIDFKAGTMKAGKLTHGTKRFYSYNDKKQVVEIVTKNPLDNNVSGAPEKFTWYADSAVRIINGYKKTVIYNKKSDFTRAAEKGARQNLTLYYTTKSDTGYVTEAFVEGIPEKKSRSWKVDEHGILTAAYNNIQTKDGQEKRTLVYCAKIQYVLLPKTKLLPEMKKAISMALGTAPNQGSFEKGDGLMEFPVKF
ncbi:MAG TPA: hypothetical protein VD905_02595 [Flavobacteriales bacterium]|nr:hypothetical protein [Flavobacteriales bacterium]